MLRARDSVGEQLVVILIHRGVSQNLILHKLIKVLKILISATTGYGMQLGNGDNIPTTRICQGVRLDLQGVEIIKDFIPLNLGSTDKIFGI